MTGDSSTPNRENVPSGIGNVITTWVCCAAVVNSIGARLSTFRWAVSFRIVLLWKFGPASISLLRDSSLVRHKPSADRTDFKDSRGNDRGLTTVAVDLSDPAGLSRAAPTRRSCSSKRPIIVRPERRHRTSATRHTKRPRVWLLLARPKAVLSTSRITIPRFGSSQRKRCEERVKYITRSREKCQFIFGLPLLPKRGATL